jgi:hypothetical protein
LGDDQGLALVDSSTGEVIDGKQRTVVAGELGIA